MGRHTAQEARSGHRVSGARPFRNNWVRFPADALYCNCMRDEKARWKACSLLQSRDRRLSLYSVQSASFAMFLKMTSHLSSSLDFVLRPDRVDMAHPASA